MRTKGKPPEPVPEPVHVPLTHDDLIREAGFRIHSRPATGPALWTKNGKTYPHEFALEVATRKQVIASSEPAVPEEQSAPEAVAVDDNVKF